MNIDRRPFDTHKWLVISLAVRPGINPYASFHCTLPQCSARVKVYPNQVSEMPDTHTLPSPTHPARMKLEPYSAEIRLSNLTLGIDNIHYDVFLSPRFVDFTRKYLLDLVRQTVNISLVYGKDKKRSWSARTRGLSQDCSRKFCRNR